jgi:hypothetical protein
VAWTWTDGDQLSLTVVNLGGETADGVVQLDRDRMAGHDWLLTDLLDGATYERSGDDLAANGLYVARPGWGAHVFRVTPLNAGAPVRDKVGGNID